MKSVRKCSVRKGARKCEKCSKAKQYCEWPGNEREESARGEGARKRKEIIDLEDSDEEEDEEDAPPPRKVARSK
jgi:hypothetical protein